MPEASFDTWTSLFLVVAAFGIFLSALLFSNKHGRPSNYKVILILLGFSLILIQYVFFWTGYNKVYTYIHFFDISWYLLFGPLFYSYVLSFYRANYKLNFGHYLPAIISLPVLGYFFIKTQGFSVFETIHGIDSYWFSIVKNPWIGIISLLIYTLLAYDLVKNHPDKGHNGFIAIRKRWTRLLSLLFAAFVVAYASYYILVQFSFFNPYWDYAISICMSFCIYGIGYMVYKEPSIFNGELLSNLFSKQASKTEQQFTSQTQTEFYNKLIDHINQNESYLDTNLRLAHLSESLGLSTHDLSKVINESGNTNFNTLINDFRLNKAQTLLRENKSITIKNVYYEVGFNSKSAFYKAFKKKFGCTPQEFRSKL
ncbi:MAG: AraC family transcriptional regulator [Gilvibacter sp.]